MNIVLAVIIIGLAATAGIEGILLRLFMQEYRKKEVKERLLEEMIEERFMEHEKRTDNRKL